MCWQRPGASRSLEYARKHFCLPTLLNTPRLDAYDAVCPVTYPVILELQIEFNFVNSFLFRIL